MEIVSQVNSFEEIPQIWRNARVKVDDTLYSASDEWDRRRMTFERNLPPHELRVNHAWGTIAFILTLGNIFHFENIRHLLYDTTETKIFDIVLKGYKHGQKMLEQG